MSDILFQKNTHIYRAGWRRIVGRAGPARRRKDSSVTTNGISTRRLMGESCITIAFSACLSHNAADNMMIDAGFADCCH